MPRLPTMSFSSHSSRCSNTINSSNSSSITMIINSSRSSNNNTTSNKSNRSNSQLLKQVVAVFGQKCNNILVELVQMLPLQRRVKSPQWTTGKTTTTMTTITTTMIISSSNSIIMASMAVISSSSNSSRSSSSHMSRIIWPSRLSRMSIARRNQRKITAALQPLGAFWVAFLAAGSAGATLAVTTLLLHLRIRLVISSRCTATTTAATSKKMMLLPKSQRVSRPSPPRKEAM